MFTIHVVMGAVWFVAAVAVIGLPLLTGRIRVGGPDATPIGRESDPRRFWTTYALSTGLFLVVSAGVAWFVVGITAAR